MVELKKLPLSKFFSIQQVAIRGTPDVLGVIQGHFIALEFKKAGDAKRTALQVLNLIQINMAGGIGIFVHPGNWNDTQRLLIDLANGVPLDRTKLQKLTATGPIPGGNKARKKRTDPRPADSSEHGSDL